MKDQYKMYVMEEVEKIARQARVEGIILGILLTGVALTVWRIFV